MILNSLVLCNMTFEVSFPCNESVYYLGFKIMAFLNFVAIIVMCWFYHDYDRLISIGEAFVEYGTKHKKPSLSETSLHKVIARALKREKLDTEELL